MLTLSLPHKVLDYACPINGLEDLYERKTGQRLPGYTLMDLSNIGFMYIRHSLAPAPRMINWGNGMGKAQYEFLADVIGYQWTTHAGGSFKNAWKAVLAELQQGNPAIIGLLDMYHLPYFKKFYRRVHIPQHFVLLVGYDETREMALVQDTSLAEIQEVPLRDLQLAWNVNSPGQGKPYTYYHIQFNDQVAGLEQIVSKGLAKRAQVFLHDQNSRFGLQAMRKASRDVNNWRKDLTAEQFKASLEFLAMFTCSVVPNMPQAMLPYPLGYTDKHQAVRERFAADLLRFAEQYQQPRWTEAAQLFQQSGQHIETLTDITVQTLQGDVSAFDQAGSILEKIAELETQAFAKLLPT
ncbi:MAG: DUF4872 domain-containing protein [Anaerolineaceae bacterium]|nr:DUF4872 domain-containing protein [Anaerolineaceae bacterium]